MAVEEVSRHASDLGPRLADVGRRGEDIAARFLTDRGARIVGRNVRVGRDEIDLLVSIDGERVVVEVKAAIDADTSSRPEENFDDAKAGRIRRAAARLDPPAWRIDLVTVMFGADGVGVRWLPGVG
jgi:Holliday junction resolvase-like predicted endonuclease